MSENIKILGKLHLIMSEINYIQKDKSNEFHKYNYASEKAIKETLQPKLIEHKVLLQVNVTNQIVQGNLTIADFSYAFHDIESGESLEGTFAGQGEDKLDKGIYKAITGAIKYILTSTFLIPTGDDPEANNSAEKEPVVSDPKALSNYQITLNEFSTLAEYKKAGRALINDAVKKGVLKIDAEDLASLRVKELTK